LAGLSMAQQHQPRTSAEPGEWPPRLVWALQKNSAWPDALAMKATLTLCLAKEGLMPDDIVFIPAVLQTTPFLLVLDLSRNNLGPHWTKVLTEGLKHTKELKELALWGCGITDVAGLNTALENTTVPGCSGINTLRLGGNRLNAQGIRTLAAAFKETSELTFLSLERNPIGAMGAQSLLLALKRVWNLKTLHLGECRLGHQGALALSEGLGHTRDMRELTLECNEIGPEGAWELVPGFQRTIQLTHLDLSWNQLGQEGVRAVAMAVQTCRHLKRLLVSGNGMDPSAEREMMAGLKQVACGMSLPPCAAVY